MDFTPFLAQLRAEHALLAHQLARRSLVFCLGSRLLVSALVRAASRPEAVLGAATTAAEGWSLVVRHRPDLLIVNDGLEQGCGVDLALRVKRHLPHIRVLLLLTRESSQARVGEAIAAGCDGVLRDGGLGAGSELAALRTICQGGMVIDRSLAAARRRRQDSRPRLTLREQQVMAGVAQGFNNQEIARRLILSADTVKTHVSRVLVKLSARDRAHAAVVAVQLGLVEWPPKAELR